MRLSVTCTLVLMIALACPVARAQEKVIVEGIVDVEAYKTNTGSYSLSRNDGHPSVSGRLQLWSAWQVSPGVQAYAMGEAESYDSGPSRETESDIQQFAVRYSSGSSAFYFIEAGKLLPPIAVASERRLSTQNPLIGRPDFLYASYPIGVQMAGSSRWFDFRAALVDLPPIDPRYVPSKPDSAFRPDLGVGVMPFAGLRIGFAYTKGPYLNKDVAPFLAAGTGWKDLDQKIQAVEFQFSRGYAELNGELAFAAYDVPFRSETLKVKDYFLELKYTWTPRLYSAVRLQRNEYPFIRHISALQWTAQDVKIQDLEFGIGYRFSADTQLKLAYRRDHWNIDSRSDAYFPAGHSLSLQLSHHFDLKSLLATDR